MLLKREIGPTIVGDGAGHERRLRRRGSGSLVRRLSSRFLRHFVSILASKCTTIRPRSRRDRAMIVVLVTLRTPSDRVQKISVRQLPDYGSIAT